MACIFHAFRRMWIVRLDAWVTAAAVLLLMLVAAEIGLRVGERAKEGSSTRVDDTTAALFGLLLGFTFSAATAKYDRRLWLMVDEATAIGDLGGVASVIAEPEGSQMKEQLRAYIDLRIEMTRMAEDPARDAALLERVRQLHSAITATAKRTIDAKNTPTVHVALVNTLNRMTTAAENRRAALIDYVPPAILEMLLVTAVLSAFALGRVQGVNRVRQRVSSTVFIALVAVALYVTLDLQQPRSGIVRVPSGALESVRSGLAR